MEPVDGKLAVAQGPDVRKMRMPHHDHIRIVVPKHADQPGFRVIRIDILINAARARMNQ
jgi:hypothetical protein